MEEKKCRSIFLLFFLIIVFSLLFSVHNSFGEESFCDGFIFSLETTWFFRSTCLAKLIQSSLMHSEIDDQRETSKRKTTTTTTCRRKFNISGKKGWKLSLHSGYLRVQNRNESKNKMHENNSLTLIRNEWTMSEIKKSIFRCHFGKLCAAAQNERVWNFIRHFFQVIHFDVQVCCCCWYYRFSALGESCMGKIVLKIFESTMT